MRAGVGRSCYKSLVPQLHAIPLWILPTKRPWKYFFLQVSTQRCARACIIRRKANRFRPSRGEPLKWCPSSWPIFVSLGLERILHRIIDGLIPLSWKARTKGCIFGTQNNRSHGMCTAPNPGQFDIWESEHRRCACFLQPLQRRRLHKKQSGYENRLPCRLPMNYISLG